MHTRAGHPLSRPFAPFEGSPSPHTAGIQVEGEPAPPATIEACADAVFGALGRLDDALLALPLPPQGVRTTRLESVEHSVKARTRRGTPLGRVRHVVVVGSSAWVPRAPAVVASHWLDREAERRAMEADVIRVLPGAFGGVPHWRGRWWIEKRDVGWGPFKVDLKFATWVESYACPDGSMLLRFELGHAPRPSSVTLYRGLARLIPDRGGTAIREVIVFGTDLAVPPFLGGKVRDLVMDTFAMRARRLVSGLGG